MDLELPERTEWTRLAARAYPRLNICNHLVPKGLITKKEFWVVFGDFRLLVHPFLALFRFRRRIGIPWLSDSSLPRLFRSLLGLGLFKLEIKVFGVVFLLPKGVSVIPLLEKQVFQNFG